MTNSRDDIVVLVADDEPSTLALVASHVRTKGYKVLEASDGDQAWQLAHEHLPDLVVLDVMMPKLDGFEACRAIKRDPDLSGTPVILLSAKGRDIDQKQGYEAGADDYITKPFSPGRLVDRVHGLLKTKTS